MVALWDLRLETGPALPTVIDTTNPTHRPAAHVFVERGQRLLVAALQDAGQADQHRRARALVVQRAVAAWRGRGGGWDGHLRPASMPLQRRGSQPSCKRRSRPRAQRAAPYLSFRMPPARFRGTSPSGPAAPPASLKGVGRASETVRCACGSAGMRGSDEGPSSPAPTRFLRGIGAL